MAHDENYITYLHVAFNNMYERAASQPAVIIPCGGPTNCEPPFEGTEADMIVDYLGSLTQRSEIAHQTVQWHIIPERESLSTLENLLFAKNILDKHKHVEHITIFCEHTRQKRVEVFAEQVFEQQVTVCAIDFDLSKNRYLDPEVIQTKETLATQEGLWTLEDRDRLALHHQLFEHKFAFLRAQQAKGIAHIDAIHTWYQHERTFLKTHMPNHPLLTK